MAIRLEMEQAWENLRSETEEERVSLRILLNHSCTAILASIYMALNKSSFKNGIYESTNSTVQIEYIIDPLARLLQN